MLQLRVSGGLFSISYRFGFPESVAVDNMRRDLLSVLYGEAQRRQSSRNMP